MLRVLSVVLCILVVCLSLCACGNNAKDDVEEAATEAMSEVADTENGTVSDGDGYIGNETTDSTTESTQSDNDNNRMFDFDNNSDVQNSTDTFM